ncbi:PepSY domain-containing protein [Crocosphaera sp. UHCC 0190]|uniref:PepSY domain-containing protein n=1 Tax=Crocosphaera sp. UHCC 0190 TaxID=3110246 RepID=UPI002B1EF676|nr:PepSY domain-containing protein [Crocosphaera sp. UHCC 0190]MEA5511346.1 PepSY domain-containing protein [Crocosphaera sp. UHCC 0190]
MINKRRLRHLHYTLAPLMIFPLLLTAITGSLFQVAELTGNARKFSWLLALHRGKFGIIDLQIIYPFLNAFGILMLGVTGIFMWLQVRRKT